MKQTWLFCLLYMTCHVTICKSEENINNVSKESNATGGMKSTATEMCNCTARNGQNDKEKKTKAEKGTSKTQTEKEFKQLIRLPSGGMLFPRASESRDLLSLDGIWSFIVDSQEIDDLRERWFEKDISKMLDAILMPVPCSYNDITTSASVRDHIGLVWYQRTFFVPKAWKTQRVWLRFGSVQYIAQVWINGKKVMIHEIGHLPFQGEITDFVQFGLKNNITVSVDNRLGPETIPQGTIEEIDTKKGPKTVQKYSFGFYNYAGIHRPVYLYTTPKVYLDDVFLESLFKGSEVFLNYKIIYKGNENREGSKESVTANIRVLDKDGVLAVSQQVSRPSVSGSLSNKIKIERPNLWWPYLMSRDPGYLYTIEIKVTSLITNITDVYRQPFGFRDIKWDNKSLYINNKSVYIRGFGRHVDSDIRGKGMDLPISMKDHNLMKWVGVNTYRTSHYPFAEETMDLAEQMGFMIIDEVPSAITRNFTQKLLIKHKVAIAELIKRDKNRACVIMWSVANEPITEINESAPYFGSVVRFTRTLDNTRPITAILNRWNTVDKAGQWMDVICFNRFNGYFKEPGQWEMIQLAVENEARYWNTRHNKPVIMTEYGTETYEGLHSIPEYLWTEEFQNKVFAEHFKAFDNLRKTGWFIGEMAYGFTDFKTDQSIKRVGTEQKKGIFTRRRHPKSSAFFIRKRNFKLAALLDGATVPNDLDLYCAPTK